MGAIREASSANDYHGSAYEFIRNNVFDARNFFNRDPSTNGALPPYRRNQFGAAVGGRIVKDRIFFFGNYEGLRRNQGVGITSTVPDDNARKGIVPICIVQTGVVCNAANTTTVPVNPIMIPYVNLYPHVNGRNFQDGTGVRASRANAAPGPRR